MSISAHRTRPVPAPGLPAVRLATWAASSCCWLPSMWGRGPRRPRRPGWTNISVMGRRARIRAFACLSLATQRDSNTTPLDWISPTLISQGTFLHHYTSPINQRIYTPPFTESRHRDWSVGWQADGQVGRQVHHAAARAHWEPLCALKLAVHHIFFSQRGSRTSPPTRLGTGNGTTASGGVGSLNDGNGITPPCMYLLYPWWTFQASEQASKVCNRTIDIVGNRHGRGRESAVRITRSNTCCGVFLVEIGIVLQLPQRRHHYRLISHESLNNDSNW